MSDITNSKFLLHIKNNFFFVVYLYACSEMFFVCVFNNFFLVLDAAFRVDVNDSLINLYAFFWTSFWYLPAFFYLALLFLQREIFFSLSSHTLIVFYFYELFDVWHNSGFSFFNPLLTNFNFFLLNNINKYHPFIFYLSVFLFISIVAKIWIKEYHTTSIFMYEQLLLRINKNLILILAVNVFALFLGSWWALQEGTWGGWWNWDASEVFGLMLTIFCLLPIHSATALIKFSLYKVYIYFCFVLFAILYVLVQLSFDLISHNFGIKFFFFFNSTAFFFLSGVMLLCATTLVLNKKITTFKSTALFFFKLKFSKTSHNIFYSFLIIFMLLLIYLLGFASVINYFLWAFFDVNLNSSTKNNCSKQLTLFFLLGVLVFFLKKKVYIPALLPALFFNFNYYLALVLVLYARPAASNLIHATFFIFITSNLLMGDTQISTLLFNCTYFFFSLQGVCLFVSPYKHILDGVFIEVCQQFFCPPDSFIYNISIFFLPFYFLTSFFAFIQNLWAYINIMYFYYLLIFSYTCIEVVFASNLMVCLFSFLFFLFNHVIKKRKHYVN